MIPKSLDDIFETQDVYAQANRTAVSKQFPLLQEALLLMFITVGVLNTRPILERRQAKSRQIPHVQSIQINLAYTAWATLVNMSRLLTFGSYVNMVSLYRDVLESFSFFWFLRREPSAVSEWQDVLAKGNSTFEEMRIAFDGFRRKVKKRFERENKAEIDYKELFYVLSTFGTHTNPYSLAGSLPSESRSQNFGIVSVGDDENLQCYAHDMLKLVMIFLEEIYAQFGKHIPQRFTLQDRVTGKNRRGHEVAIYRPISLALPGRYAQLKKDFKRYDSSFEGQLKLY